MKYFSKYTLEKNYMNGKSKIHESASIYDGKKLHYIDGDIKYNTLKNDELFDILDKTKSSSKTLMSRLKSDFKTKTPCKTRSKSKQKRSRTIKSKSKRKQSKSNTPRYNKSKDTRSKTKRIHSNILPDIMKTIY